MQYKLDKDKEGEPKIAVSKKNKNNLSNVEAVAISITTEQY